MITHDQAQFELSYFTENNVKAGKLRYRYIADNVIDVFTTKVEPEFQGKGIAGELYNAIVAFAQQNGLKIKPSCSYIAVKMERNHADLIA